MRRTRNNTQIRDEYARARMARDIQFLEERLLLSGLRQAPPKPCTKTDRTKAVLLLSIGGMWTVLVCCIVILLLR